MPFFAITRQDKKSRARAGIIRTSHGNIETPAFMPVGTQGAVKTLDNTDLEKTGAQVILGNTYHLHLRPGEDLIAKMGGLHRFIGWNKPILTDSGGFQIFSLGLQKTKKQIKTAPISDNLTKKQSNNQTVARTDNWQGGIVSIDEDGVTFKSHIDGSRHRFTPESAIEAQNKLGADIIMALDECTPDEAPYEYARAAMERTHRWAERCLRQHVILSPDLVGINSVKNPLPKQRGPSATPRDDKSYHQFLFGIIQGARYRDLRVKSAKLISSLDFDGIAVGGESIGYNMGATKKILSWIYPYLPENKPHYTMGVGLDPADLLEVIEWGADMFDCVGPTRLARHGMLFCHYTENHGIAALPSVARNDIRRHRINIKNAAFNRDTRPIDPNCACSTCQRYSRAYLHHLFNAGEITAMRLASIHNLHFTLDLMRQAREAIKNDEFPELKKKWI